MVCKQTLKSLPLTPHNLAPTVQNLFNTLAPQKSEYEEAEPVWEPHPEATHGHGNPHPDWGSIMDGVKNHEFHNRAASRHPGYAEPVGGYPSGGNETHLVVTGTREEMLALQAQLRCQGHTAEF